MAVVDHQGVKRSYRAASQVHEYAIVTKAGEGAVVAAGSVGARPRGTTDVVGSPNIGLTVYEEGNFVKLRAAASLGADTEIGVVGATTSYGPVSGASGVTRWSIGTSEAPAAAGDLFTVKVHPRQLSNLI